jgi:hypothetical protein
MAMQTSAMQSELTVEQLDQDSGHCDCCGNTSHSVWGFVHRDERTVAAYWVHWTEGHLGSTGANWDFIVGSWGDESSASDRFAASLLYREPEGAAPAFMVIDATDRPVAESNLVASALDRDDISGTPLSDQLFALVDAIWIQDARLTGFSADPSV